MKYIENIDREWRIESDPDRLRHAIDLREMDSISALDELQALADDGSALAMLYIGDTYGNGRGVPRDVERGDHWYQRAADRGSIEASHRLAFGYYHSRDYQKSIELLGRLSDLGFIPAMYCLGSFYFTGTGVDKDMGKAVECWIKAESGGHLVAKRRVSIILRSGVYGFVGRIRGFLKMLRLIYPFVIYNMKKPRSDRLRDW